MSSPSDPRDPEPDAAEVLAPAYTGEKPPVERGPDHDEPKNRKLDAFTHRTPQDHEAPPEPRQDPPPELLEGGPRQPETHPERRPVTGPPAQASERNEP